MREYQRLTDADSPIDGGDLSSISKSRQPTTISTKPLAPPQENNAETNNYNHSSSASKLPSPVRLQHNRGSLLELAVLKSASSANLPPKQPSTTFDPDGQRRPSAVTTRIKRSLISSFTSPSFSSLPQDESARLSSNTRLPKDSGQVKLILGIAKALATYGAPLYRVSHRAQEAADRLNVPFGILCLPSTLMITTGDASPNHPTQSHFIDYTCRNHVGKLQDIDRLARKTRYCAPPRSGKHSPTKPPPNTLKSNAASPNGDVRTPPLLQRKPSRASEIQLDDDDDDEDNDEDRTTKSVKRKASSSSMRLPPTVDELLGELDDIIEREDDYPVIVNVITQGLSSALLALLLFGSDFMEAGVCFALGCISGLTILLSDASWLKCAEILVPFTVAIISRLIHLTPLGRDFCHPMVSLVSCSAFFPGYMLAMGMLEAGSNNAGGAVRVFQAFLRSLKLGYGLSLGSRLVTSMIGESELSGGACAAPHHSIDLWRIPFFIPLNFVVMIMFRAKMKQWFHITIISFISFCVILVGTQFFAKDTATLLAAFALGLGGNIYARLTNDIGIAAILCGMIWLTPGSLGVNSARQMFDSTNGELAGGTLFGIDMMTRGLSIAIGLYVANVVVFPLSKDKVKAADATL
ncbi:hypothetical protein SmJEL517_g05881 [Synchytrium microbalum]|uniref:Threonine/serine exporter-like N-terminal domain-containing protein n=1 Tax=Synchytrium microbalum TaxID=1806994 RepID=A0A507BLJ4_9FUNG|nr:uncharacterized protein SmJEL517_g05881 [Synchytrium microbalum]TPX30577.1 hypothetical protein SmJEL517_g05881 [Synchytrium microbalum]